jgi:hypothetical protein
MPPKRSRVEVGLCDGQIGRIRCSQLCRVSGPASGRSVRTADVRRKGGDIRQGNSRTGTTARDAESYKRSTGSDLIRD